MRQTIDCTLQPKIHFPTFGEVKEHRAHGTVVAELRANGDLYLNGRKVVVRMIRDWKDTVALLGNLGNFDDPGEVILSANIMDAIFENPDLAPRTWKVEDYEKRPSIHFLGTRYVETGGFRNSNFVYCLMWDRNGFFHRIPTQFHAEDPLEGKLVALLEAK